MNATRRPGGLLLAALIVVIGLIMLGQADHAVQAQDDASDTGARVEMTPVEVVEEVAPAVVTVINKQVLIDLQGSGILQPAGSGTGFIIDRQGHIVTNAHVVAGGEEFEVIFSDGEKRSAELIGADGLSDLAVIEVDGRVPGSVELGDSDALKPGQPVLAIGSPLGSFTNTVTQGIVSALGRDIGSVYYTNLIQHDAAINPGNSGGPLFNLAGEVVGVNTLGIDETRDGRSAQGLFFAIPSNTVQTITSRLIEDGRVVYPYFGVTFQAVTDQVAAQFELEVDSGVLVTAVENGDPADDAGIEVGDVIVAIEDEQITQQQPFIDILFGYEPGDTVEVIIQRGDEQLTVDVTLGERPSDL